MDPLLAIATFLHGRWPVWLAILSPPLAVVAIYLPWTWYRRFLTVRRPPFLSIANVGTILVLATAVNIVLTLLYVSSLDLISFLPDAPISSLLILAVIPGFVGTCLTEPLAHLTYLGLPLIVSLGLLPFVAHIGNVALRGLDPIGRQACRSIKLAVGLSAIISTSAWSGFFNAIYWANNTGIEKFGTC